MKMRQHRKRQAMASRLHASQDVFYWAHAQFAKDFADDISRSLDGMARAIDEIQRKIVRDIIETMKLVEIDRMLLAARGAPATAIGREVLP